MGDKLNNDESFSFDDEQLTDEKVQPVECEENKDGGKMIQMKEAEYKALVEELASMKDKNIRLFAEFDNARKRMERDKQEFIKFANEELIIEFLGVLDNLDRSVAAARSRHEDYVAFLKGVELVMAQIYEMLKKQGVTPVESLGKKFDPHFQEVLMQEETDKVDEGIVLEEFQKGYLLNNRLLRTAKVKLSKTRTATENQEEKY